MKNKTLLIITACIAGFICTSLSASAAAKKAASSPAPESSASPAASPAKAPRGFPLHGMVSAVDQSAKTFTIAGKKASRVFKVTDKTTVTKGPNPATMQDIVENVEVNVYYWKNADGSLEAKTVKIGPMGEKKETGKKKASASESPAASPATSPKK